jgi:hypothetical protein
MKLHRFPFIACCVLFVAACSWIWPPRTQAQSLPASLSAADANVLQKLMPLTADEEKLFDKTKDNPVELHKFIVTRTYMRLVVPIVEKKYPDWQKQLKDNLSYLPNDFLKTLPKEPDDLGAAYVIGEEFDLIWDILLAQT